MRLCRGPLFRSLCHYKALYGSRRLNHTVPFLLADIGEGITEVEVLEWHVKEGQRVNQFDKIAEVQSDKATVEITSRFDGVIKKIHYSKGATAKVGNPLIDIEVEDDQKMDAPKKPTLPNNNSPTTTIVVNPSSPSNTPFNSKALPIRNPSSQAESEQPIKAMPSVRHLAKQLGIDLTRVSATGNSGQITRADIEQAASFAQQGLASAHSNISLTFNKSPLAINSTEHHSTPLTAFQKAMVKSMQASLTIPHFGYSEEALVDRLLELRRDLIDPIERAHGIKLTPMSFYLKALSLALLDYPTLNSHYDSTSQQVKQFKWHNMAIAVDTEHGLAVPVVKAVQSRSIVELAKELTRLTEAARLNRLDTSDLRDATITVSNIGVIGGTGMSPVIMAPQVAIVAMGRVKTISYFNDSSMTSTPRAILPLAWSADHRVVDGATIAKLTRRWKELIESPAALLLYLQNS